MSNRKTVAAIERPELDYWDGMIDETDASQFLNQSVRTLQKWRLTGYGPPFYKIGRSIRYKRRVIQEWLESRMRRHTSQI